MSAARDLGLGAPGPLPRQRAGAQPHAETERETHEWIDVRTGFQQAVRAVVVWPGGQRRGPVVVVNLLGWSP